MHLPSQKWVDGKHQCLEQKTTMKRDPFWINVLRLVVYHRFSENGVTCEYVMITTNLGDILSKNEPVGMELNKTRPFVTIVICYLIERGASRLLNIHHFVMVSQEYPTIQFITSQRHCITAPQCRQGISRRVRVCCLFYIPAPSVDRVRLVYNLISTYSVVSC